MYVLGEFFSWNIRTKNNHKLIQHGPYKYFRHPSYFGSVLCYLGLGLSSQSLVSVFLLPIGISIIYFYRTSIEEIVLMETFSEQYQIYRKKTWGFLPFIK